MMRSVMIAVACFVVAACSDDSGRSDQGDGGTNQDAGRVDGRVTDASADLDGSMDGGGDAGPTVTQWDPFVVTTLEADEDHAWNEFPLQVTFSHAESGSTLILDGYWLGGRSWAVRFAATKVGRWTWSAGSETGDTGLEASGGFVAKAPTADEQEANANFHGHVRVEGRYFQYADGTTFLPLGDTIWGINSMEPLGALDGEFYTYIDNRVAKGFNTLLVMYLAEYNEGGYLTDPDTEPPDDPDLDWSVINPDFFESLDTRVEAIWERGLVLFGHPTWLVEEPDITVAQAVNLSRYLLARYGAYNLVWSLTGEFQEACGDGTVFCDDDFAGVADLGRWLGGSDDVDPVRPGFNPFGHPMSVHPGGYDPGAPDPGMQTSRMFDGEDWLDHHWIQTYKETDKIVYRVSELRGLTSDGLSSGLPVLLSEPYYEGYPGGRYTDWDQGSGAEKDANTARRQGWLSMFAGAAGHIYGAQGVWQATDVDRIDLVGAGQMHHIKDFLLEHGWPALGPADCVEVRKDGTWDPPSRDYPEDAGDRDAVLAYAYAPRCLMEDGRTVAVYIPAGNEGRSIRVVMLGGLEYRARWFNPRDGSYDDIDGGNPVNDDHDDRYSIPSRPSPSDNDWVLVLTHQ